MKRLTSLLVLVCLIFGLSACTEQAEPSVSGGNGSAGGFWVSNSQTKPSGDTQDKTESSSSADAGASSGNGSSGESSRNWLVPDPEPQPIDPNSNILPDLGSFLMCNPGTAKDFVSGGRQLQWNGSYPYELYESTKTEIIDLLLEPEYQLVLRESKPNSHYTGTVITDIFFDYTGTNPDIVPITDEYGENTFHLRLRVTPYEEYGHFKINAVYAPGFTLAQPESHVSRDITPGGDMRWLTVMDESKKPASSAGVFIPCLEDFLYRECTRTADHYAYGDLYGREEDFQNLPLAAYETVKEEVLELLSKPLYQLRLLESRQNSYYYLTAWDYYFEYRGTNEDITPITDKYEQKYNFDLMVRFLPDEETGKFQLYLFYNQNFEPIVTSYHTTRDVSRDGDGSELPEDYRGSSSSDSDFFEKCSSCHGSGKCTHCNGTGEVSKFQAGLGWVDLDCTLCNRGKCRHCGGDGKK